MTQVRTQILAVASPRGSDFVSTSIVIVRHGEKPSTDGSVNGVNPAGIIDPGSLSVRGWQRSGALASFAMQGRLGQVPTSLVAAKPASVEASKRAVQTLTPLSELLAKPIFQEFAVGQEMQLAAALVLMSGLTFVAWEHKAIHLIGNAIMGSADAIPQSWASDRFDLLWTFTLSDLGWAFNASGQHLLSGDLDP